MLSTLYRKCKEQIIQLMPDEYETRQENMSWLLVGLFLSGSVYLNEIALKLPFQAKKLSVVRRLRRFLDNGAIRVREWYHPVARELLTAAGSAGQVHLILDTSKVSAGHRLLMVAVAYRRRALPIAWTWVRTARGHCTTRKQIALLGYVESLLPTDVQVSLVGDHEFGRPLLMEYLDGWGWDYVLRQAKNNVFMPKNTGEWVRFDAIPIHHRDFIWFGNVILTRPSAYPTHVVLHWKPGEKDPWYLATNLPCPRLAVRTYRRRMWIEELFGDFKGHGFDLELSRLKHIFRLSRLTLAVCLLYVWLIALGEQIEQHPDRAAQIDRSDRRDLSIFRLGRDFLERCFWRHHPLPSFSLPSFCLVSGS